jgi:hypothetical protein
LRSASLNLILADEVISSFLSLILVFHMCVNKVHLRPGPTKMLLSANGLLAL